MNLEETKQILYVLLDQFNIDYKQQLYGNSAIFDVVKFGTKIVYLDGQTFDRKILDGWHVGWVHPDYTVTEAREKIVWALVRGGYFHYLRNNYKNTFAKLLSSQGWDRLLINYRLKQFKNDPKFNYLRDINSTALTTASSYVIAMDPGFFDWIIE